MDMITLLITLIILSILTIGIRLGNGLKEVTFSPGEQVVATILSIVMLIWEFNILFSLL